MRERMLHEQNVRLNRDHALLLNRAPEVWEEFKAAFVAECTEISARAVLTRLRSDEPDSRTFLILRERPHTPAVAALSFEFDGAIPCIAWQDLHNKKPRKTIEMAMDESAVLFVQSGKAIILSRFIEQCLETVYF